MYRCAFALMLLVGITSCSTVSSNTNTKSPQPVTVHVVEYKTGPNWDANKAPEEQNLGGHLQMVSDKFDAKELLANGPTLDDFHGFYIFNVENEEAVRVILKSDQALLSGVLQEVKVEKWQLMMENLGADIGTKQLFILNYNPGTAWKQGKTLSEQDITEHKKYVGNLFHNGEILAGGPVTDTLGRYIVAGTELTDIENMVKADPSVVANTFDVKIKPWAPFNRQGL